VQEYARREKLLWVLNRLSTSTALKDYFMCSHRLRAVYPELSEEDVSVVETLIQSGQEPPAFGRSLSELGIHR